MKCKSMIAALALLMTSGAAHAADPTSTKERYIENAAGAIALAAECPAWQVDATTMSEMLNFLHIPIADISPDGKYWPVIDKYNEITRALTEQEACRAAEGLYGPNGTVAPNMMIKKPH